MCDMPDIARRPLRSGWRGALCALAAILLMPAALAAAPAGRSFASPEAAVAALVAAVEANDPAALRAILGRAGSKLARSGDPVADLRSRKAFIAAYRTASKIVQDSDAQATLTIGKDDWPLPFPLVKAAAGWRFDTAKGEREILARRIGRNELSAIQVCLAVVDAEREYFAKDRDDNGAREYAPKFVSAAGKRDGLYWPSEAGEPASPLGPLLAAAARDGYGSATAMPLAPYHGYFYRILTAQGEDAPGGAYDYIAEGRMTRGFAVIAYPARYRASGVMSFMVGQDGVVYQKNLGRHGGAIASKMTAYNPDASWKRTQTVN